MGVALWLATLVSAKLVLQRLVLTPDSQWRYLTKFAMDTGKGAWSVRLQLVSPLDQESPDWHIHLGVYLDESWPATLTAPTCTQKTDLATKDRTLIVPSTGEWTRRLDGSLTQYDRPRIWYFSLSTCTSAQPKAIEIEAELMILNSDGGHWSLEEQGLVYIYGVFLLIFGLGIGVNVNKAIEGYDRTERLEINLTALILAIGVQLTGLILETLHWLLYYFDGYGLLFFDFFAQIADFLSQFIISLLLILVTTGWTLKHKQLPAPETFVPILTVLLLVNFCTILLAKGVRDSSFSDYEGLPGVLLLACRLGLFAWFVVGMRDLEKGTGGQQRLFIGYFGLVGTGYFLSLPLLVVGSWALPDYYRNLMVITGSLTIQALTFALLTTLYDSQSTFYRISTLSHSVLPGKSK